MVFRNSTGSSFRLLLARLALIVLSSRSSTALVGHTRPLHSVRQNVPLQAVNVNSAAATMVAAATLVLGTPLTAWAGDGFLTEPQHLVAEAWRQVRICCCILLSMLLSIDDKYPLC